MEPIKVVGIQIAIVHVRILWGVNESVHYGSPLMNSLNLLSQGPVRVTVTNTYANKSQTRQPKIDIKPLDNKQ